VKGRLELNFLMPNTELLTGRRLQPYYDRADGPRLHCLPTMGYRSRGQPDAYRAKNRPARGTASRLA
ncbi:plasmid mobilization relaxase MbeA, partial [Enterobacter hormaechei]